MKQNYQQLQNVYLNSFQNKYLYYAIDDILYLLKSNLVEQANLVRYFIFSCSCITKQSFH
jgi:hypothetical protein